MTYFITAKQIVEYEAESERPTSKKERTKNGKNKQVPCILLETEIHSTRKRRTLNAGERVCNKPNGSITLCLLNSGKQFHVLTESITEKWIRLRVLSCCSKITSPLILWRPAREFWLICSVNKSFILMWFYQLWQNEWLFWKQCLYKWS